ncbi:hypothetical protein RB195_026142 [Necator americanus]|uniref:Uncharacterized protein n=1 Tax=Necator americanus TaxID=51031 RepID=A0ABR1EVJ8_NECAM
MLRKTLTRGSINRPPSTHLPPSDVLLLVHLSFLHTLSVALASLVVAWANRRQIYFVVLETVNTASRKRH